jgi:hypothetical protein
MQTLDQGFEGGDFPLVLELHLFQGGLHLQHLLLQGFDVSRLLGRGRRLLGASGLSDQAGAYDDEEKDAGVHEASPVRVAAKMARLGVAALRGSSRPARQRRNGLAQENAGRTVFEKSTAQEERLDKSEITKRNPRNGGGGQLDRDNYDDDRFVGTRL